MTEEYKHLLSAIDINTALACSNGYVDAVDCSWYHKNWMFLRALGIVSNPFWHEQFFANQLKAWYAKTSRVLVLGTADFSMPLLCSTHEVEQIDICDICQTPLNVCDIFAMQKNLNWKTFCCDIRNGIDGCYDIIINDAFLTRFTYSEKPKVLQRIRQALTPGGIYITTIRNDWNAGRAFAPSESQKGTFIKKAKQIAESMSMDVQCAENAANTYINNMISYPMENKQSVIAMAEGILAVMQCTLIKVPGEIDETSYFQVVFQKLGDV